MSNVISAKEAPPAARSRRTICHSEHRPLHKSLAHPSSAPRCKPRFDLMGALQTSQGARLPTIAASCAVSDSSSSKRKTPWTTRREQRGSRAPVDHSKGHTRSRRLSHPNADDLRPVDSRSWRQPHGYESHATTARRDRTSTAQAAGNSNTFICTNHMTTAIAPVHSLGQLEPKQAGHRHSIVISSKSGIGGQISVREPSLRSSVQSSK
ncbi:hypothetical protein Enr13x_20020 [Stieleria neptunia]|uniref:Uncharacterized protein n=1 Tax=Stieleria neptunia TaxID=2527979 RepID=A0A518HMW8_9BACT|nr:hypothetical protein Enr13x_20020 [Stieleria neptunia]